MTEALFDLDDMGGKDPYHWPTVKEASQWDNGLTVASSFSGGGGSSTGLHYAGWRVPYASEFIPSARETYQANWPDTYVDGRDIREVQPEDVMDIVGVGPGELDLWEGSPPCSSFSGMGNRGRDSRFGAGKVKNYSDGVKQNVDDLFDEWLRLLEGLMPKAAMAENVPDILHDKSWDFYTSIHARLADLGYRSTANIYNAMHYGAATWRKRIVFVAVRRDVGPLPEPPRRTPVGYSIGEALATLPREIPEDELKHMNAEGYATGTWWHQLKPGERWPAFSQCMRVSPDDPLPSITTSGNPGGANPMHWSECRLFTPTETSWAFGYPSDYVLCGDPGQRHERVARSVAPPLYLAHGKALATILQGANK